MEHQAIEHVGPVEPLEIRVDGERIATTMRTPGYDARLAVGFLFSRGILRAVEDASAVTRCGRPGCGDALNIVDVRSGARGPLDTDGWESSSVTCVQPSDALSLHREGGGRAGPRIDRVVVARAVDHVRGARGAVGSRACLHAAAAFDEAGELLACHVDVGRHNAVDKTIGALLYRRLAGRCCSPHPRPALLAVSGRVTFAIVQKAVAAKINVVASAAATSLAIDLALSANVTLAILTGDGSFDLPTHPGRIAVR